MNCFLCGKKIGLLRSLTDQQYCCVEHRKEARMASAMAVRDEEDVESWAVARSRKRTANGAKAAATPASQAGAVLAFLAVGSVMAAVLMMGGAARGGAAYPSVSFETGKKPGVFQRAGGAMSDWVRDIAPITLQHQFSGGNLGSSLSDWSSYTVRAGLDKIDDPRDWIGKTKTSASLRLWKKSTALENYRMEFQAKIEKNSLSWAVRASDAKNFYATQLSIIKAGPLPNAGLIRRTMIDGREVDRTLSQLPLTLERNVNYHVSVNVQGDQISTYLNGQFIGRLTDKRLTRGGVGFFDDANDPQKVAWVSVSERDSFLGRMLAHFALLIIPGEQTSFGN
ncbi:MAG: hypothetical protein WDO18_17135 [Acidobacteriota bacterium]